MREVGVDLTTLIEMEPDAGLGNGGLGRLAACFLDSLATLSYPGMGYGIRYEFGIFTQDIVDGYQVERADEWLKFGNPWEIVRPEKAVNVRFFGRVEHHTSADGRSVARWVARKTVVGVPFDTPIAGFGNNTVNTLRLWQARASEEFDLRLFNAGDYERSVVEKNDSEVISKVLYPNDAFQAGQGAAAQAAVLLRGLLHRGHCPALPEGPHGLPRVPHQGGHPAQRHAPGHRGGGADARAGGRAADTLGRGVPHHPADVRLHEPHAAGRGDGEVAGDAVRAPAAAPPGDHLRDQPALPAAGADPLPVR